MYLIQFWTFSISGANHVTTGTTIYINPPPGAQIDYEKIFENTKTDSQQQFVTKPPEDTGRLSDKDVSDAIRRYYNISYGTNLPPLPEIQRSYNYCVELIIEDLSDKRDRDIR